MHSSHDPSTQIHIKQLIKKGPKITKSPSTPKNQQRAHKPPPHETTPIQNIYAGQRLHT